MSDSLYENGKPGMGKFSPESPDRLYLLVIVQSLVSLFRTASLELEELCETLTLRTEVAHP